MNPALPSLPDGSLSARPAVAAVSVVAPSARFGEAELAHATDRVIEAARRLERALRGA